MAEIYVTSAKSDQRRATAIAGALGAAGWSVLGSGDPVPDESEPAYDANCVVALWSAESVNDPVVNNEAIAGSGRKRLVHALIDDVRPPRRFKRAAMADMIDWDLTDRNDPGLLDLVGSVRAVLDRQDDDLVEEARFESVAEDDDGPPPIPEGNLFGGSIVDFEGHDGEVYDLAVDGTMLASASADGTAILWDLADGTPVVTLDCGSEVNDVSLNPNGTLTLTASADGLVRMWRTKDGAERHRLAHHEGTVYWAAFSPAGDLAASAGADALVVVWRVESLEVVWEFQHDEEVPTARFSPDGTVLATADDEGDVTLWDLESGEALRVIDAHDGAITDIAMSPDGTLLATASATGDLSMWDLTDGSLRWWSGVIAGAVYGMCFSPDGRLLAESDDEGISLWSAADGDLVDFISDPNATRLEFSPVGNRLVWASDDLVRTIAAP